MTTYAIMVLAALAGGIIQPLTGFGSAVILMVAGQYFFDMTVAPSVAANGQGHSPLRDTWGYGARGKDCHTGVRAGSQ